MATKLFLRNTTSNGITDSGDGILYDLSTSAGSSVDTSVTNTSASGTQIQATKTAGGSTVAWISGRAPSGGFTLTAVDISLWQVESNMNANIGGRYRVFKRSAAGVVTEVGGGPFNDGVEMNTADREDLWAGNVTDTVFAEDDRILIRYYITNVGTMASGHTGTMKFNAADAATGDSFFNIAETVAFKPDDISVALTGVSATGAAGSLGKSVDKALTGDSATASLGSLTPNITKALTGNQITGAVGNVSPSGSPILAGLRAAYKFTESAGSTRNDSAGPSHLAEAGGTVAKVAGHIGDAVRFSEGAYLAVADNVATSITGDGSLWLWFTLSAAGTLGFPGLMGKWAADQRGYAIRYERSLNRILFSVSADGTNATHAIFNSPSTGVSYFARARIDHANDRISLSVTQSGAGSLAAWVDEAYTAGSVFDSSADFEIGRLGTSTDVFAGDINAPGLSDRVLTEEEWEILWSGGEGLQYPYISLPIARAGFNQTRTEGETVMLDGSWSFDPGGITSYLWEQLSGTAVTLDDDTAVTPTFTAPADPATLVFKLTVENAEAQTAEAQVTVTIVDTTSTVWRSFAPQEVGITDTNTFYAGVNGLLAPSMVVCNGRIIGYKGDITLEGYVWSASKMICAMVFARLLRLTLLDYTDTVPGSDNPTSPTATVDQFLAMISDFGLTPHSPGDHYAYNNAGMSFFAEYMNATFFTGDDPVEFLQNAFVNALNFDDALIYELTTWAGENHFSGWNGGWKMSTQDLGRIAQLILQSGAWEGTQLLDPDFINTEIWTAGIPLAATPSTDISDPFFNQDLGTAMADCWTKGFWIAHAMEAPRITVEETLLMSGAFGTSVFISRQKNCFIANCNTGGETINDNSVALSGAAYEAVANTLPNQLTLDLTSVSATGAVGTAAVSGDKALSGNEATSELGSLNANTNISIFGNEAPGVVGSVMVEAPNDIILALTGVSATSQLESLAHDRALTLPGLEASTALGTTSQERDVPIIGVDTSLSVGNLIAVFSFTVSGNQGVADCGDVMSAFEVPALGVTATAAAGTLNVSTSLPISGNQIEATIGALTAEGESNVTVALSGISLSTALGSLTPVLMLAISGAQSDTEIDDLSAERSIGLPSLEASAEAGILIPETSKEIPGVDTTAVIGSVHPFVSLTIIGLAVSSGVGTVALSSSRGLTGVQGLTSLGNFTVGDVVIEIKGPTTITLNTTGKTGITINNGQTSTTIS